MTLTARNRISRRAASELAGEMFGARLSTGSVDAVCQHASGLLAGPYRQLRDWICAQDALHVDETGWRTAGDSRALWTLSAPGASIFEIAEHCSREQFDELIGPFPGIVISDRWPGYEHLDPDRRQVCWSQLRRDFRRHSEGLAEQTTFGEHGLKLTRHLFAAGAPTSTSITTALVSKPSSSRSNQRCERCSKTPAARANAPGITAGSPTITAALSVPNSLGLRPGTLCCHIPAAA